MSQSTTFDSPASVDTLPREPGRRAGTPGLPAGLLVFIQGWTGMCVGSTVALLAFLAARYAVPPWRSFLGPLTLLAPVAALATLLLIRHQMRDVRSRSFRRRVRGAVQEVQIRRRGEVLWEIAKRGALLALLCLLLVCAAHGAHGLLRQVGLVRASSLLRTVPALGRWLSLGGMTLLISGVLLASAEVVALLTRKQGYRHQDVALFAPAAIAFGLTLGLLRSL